MIGGGEPALPGVSIGHNEQGAWGFTIFPIDQEDLYVYQTDPAVPSSYLYQGAWESFQVVPETFAVKGQEKVQVALRYTRHGPVLYEDVEHHRVYALRAAWLEEGAAPYLASLRIDQAKSWAEFREACRHFRTPSENLIWADLGGHIGWQAVGLAPVRGKWDGLVPVPGDGRYEWDGYLPPLELPHSADPSRGWLATANQDNLPRGYPHAVGFQWTDPFRFARIEEVLGSGRRFTRADMMELQQDELSLPAVTRAHAARSGAGGGQDPARRRPAPLLGLRSEQELGGRRHRRHLGKSRAPCRLGAARSPRGAFGTSRQLRVDRAFDPVADGPRRSLRHRPDRGTERIAEEGLDQAMTELERRLGPDVDHWKYGQEVLKHITLKHPLSDAVEPGLRARIDLGPLPRGGSAHTVNSTSDSENQATGASFRLITDLADWDLRWRPTRPASPATPTAPTTATSSGPGPAANIPRLLLAAQGRIGHRGNNAAGAPFRLKVVVTLCVTSHPLSVMPTLGVSSCG